MKKDQKKDEPKKEKSKLSEGMATFNAAQDRVQRMAQNAATMGYAAVKSDAQQFADACSTQKRIVERLQNGRKSPKVVLAAIEDTLEKFTDWDRS